MYRRTLQAGRFFFSDDRGIAITEYGMLVAFLALVIIAVVIVAGGNLSNWFGTKTGQITTV